LTKVFLLLQHGARRHTGLAPLRRQYFLSLRSKSRRALRSRKGISAPAARRSAPHGPRAFAASILSVATLQIVDECLMWTNILLVNSCRTFTPSSRKKRRGPPMRRCGPLGAVSTNLELAQFHFEIPKIRIFFSLTFYSQIQLTILLRRFPCARRATPSTRTANRGGNASLQERKERT
jgi:hypothetical protein